ncbi:Pycsar system effector family protein [Pengzhenrongella phosphoraccumulans]|uniref:Pycsar system effector family protein n=1 Tax=Pengzhenrongella phosphoraccumulans TaxID=3114394 RepID=UPI00388D10E6
MRSKRVPKLASTSDSKAVENAWQIHDAQMDWTGKVDTKAAFALTFQTAILAVAVSLLPDMDTRLEYALNGLSILLVSAGAVFAASVVAPALRMKHVAAEAASNFIYFGHARAWEPDALADELRRTDLTDQVARQVVVMAKIVWGKHRRVAWSIWLAVVGGGLLLASAVVSRI